MRPCNGWNVPLRKETGLFLVKGDPPFKSLEVDPRYKAFLRRNESVGMTAAATAHRNGIAR